MADKKDNKDEEISGEESGTLKQASQEARARAIAKMRETQDQMEKQAGEQAAEKEEAETTSHAGSMSDFVGKADEDSGKLVLEAEGPTEQMIDESTGQPLLRQVKVYSPFKVYFDNDAFSISATNGTGPFDILPGHKNFLSLLLPGELNIRARSGDEKLKIERGIMHVHGDVVRVFLDV
ncbi:MAG: hypothetical protein R3313_04450 [Candidatus Saccharimonadales bacterium]|nr:hypothetical protein [Candidatus Saccharimonadales bacterium]